MKCWAWTVFFIAAAWISGAHAADAALAADDDLEIARGATITKDAVPAYPLVDLNYAHEGWVRLNFMVDPKGKPYEISVEGSLGGKPFEENAIRALERTQFEPAMLDGQPIHSSVSRKYRFAIRDLEKGASINFVSRYRAILKKIASGDRAGADQLLPKFAAKNLYEDAYRNLALSQYSRAWGTEAEQIGYLEAAIAGETTDRYLNKSAFVEVVGALLALNIKRGYVAECIHLWKILQRTAPPESVEPWRVAMTEVQKFADSTAAFKLRGELVGEKAWFHTLVRHQFRITVLSGRVEEIKLRCKKGYLFFRFDPALKYTVNRESGRCAMQVIGDPGTAFELVEG